ncbi:MAG: hypothetical protein K6F77_09605 [Lachnospiraceae bacterium]|nr:hypothetical protein [Lachnospiraceae bacterium]
MGNANTNPKYSKGKNDNKNLGVSNNTDLDKYKERCLIPTKSVDKIKNEFYIKEIIENTRENIARKHIEKVIKNFEEKCKGHFLKIENKNVIYLPEDGIFMPDYNRATNIKRYNFYSNYYYYYDKDFRNEYSCRRIYRDEAHKYFNKYYLENVLIKSNAINVNSYGTKSIIIFGQNYYEEVKIDTMNSCLYDFKNGSDISWQNNLYNDFKESIWLHVCPVYKYKIDKDNNVTRIIPPILEVYSKYGFTPYKDDSEEGKNFNEVLDFIKNKYLKIKNSNDELINPTFEFTISDKCLEKIRSGEIKSIGNTSLAEDTIRKILSGQQENEYINVFECVESLKQSLLECDYIRHDSDIYDEKRLVDTNRGHWDLWFNDDDKNLMDVKGCDFIARNPAFDAYEHRNEIIGIDFGTKSTVVTKISGSNRRLIQVGNGKSERTITGDMYENPTVIEFADLNSFWNSYSSKITCPKTRWNDVAVSHTAYDDMKDSDSNQRGDDFASFFSSIKQWCNKSERIITIKDKNGKVEVLKPFLKLNSGEIDPVEIYAYYIGCYINNMTEGVYLRYRLAFPVTYEKDVKEKIRASFERGIKKTIPNEVLENKWLMDKFSIEYEMSEPAAYALCALQEYDIDPENGEKILYGIFDFGGGTTDFDFGFWEEYEDSRNYDYQITHFGASGDMYLGGENILEEIAFEVFKHNIETQNKMIENIYISRPFGRKEEVGDNAWVNDSQQAQSNLKQISERLRPYWEEKGKIEDKITLSLIDDKGKLKSKIELEVVEKDLDAILNQKIENGIDQFFEAFKNAQEVHKDTHKIDDCDSLNIFLAGNSCRSHRVTKLFQKKITKYEESITGASKNDKKTSFKVYPALGTTESFMIIKGELEPNINDIVAFQEKLTPKKVDNKNDLKDKKTDSDKKGNKKETKEEKEKVEVASVDVNSNQIDLTRLKKPTGKTGVAFGLLENRVKILSEITKNDEISFKYYLGVRRKKHFCMLIDKSAKYNVWNYFCDDIGNVLEIFYTDLPMATSNEMDIALVPNSIILDFDNDNYDADDKVYIRFVKPDEFEYIVAKEKDYKEGKIDEEYSKLSDKYEIHKYKL